MTRLFRTITLAFVAMLAAGTAMTAVAQNVAHAARTLSPCAFNFYHKTDYRDMPLPDKNYIDVTFGIWQIPPSGCTQWAGHNFGNTEMDIDYQLGTTADYFTSSTTSYIFGADQLDVGNSFATTGEPFYLECTYPGKGWVFIGYAPVTCGTSGAQLGDIWSQPIGILGGTDGNTNVEFVTPLLTQGYGTPCTANGQTRDYEFTMTAGEFDYTSLSLEMWSGIFYDGGPNGINVPYDFFEAPTGNVAWDRADEAGSC